MNQFKSVSRYLWPVMALLCLAGFCGEFPNQAYAQESTASRLEFQPASATSTHRIIDSRYLVLSEHRVHIGAETRLEVSFRGDEPGCWHDTEVQPGRCVAFEIDKRFGDGERSKMCGMAPTFQVELRPTKWLAEWLRFRLDGTFPKSMLEASTEDSSPAENERQGLRNRGNEPNQAAPPTPDVLLDTLVSRYKESDHVLRLPRWVNLKEDPRTLLSRFQSWVLTDRLLNQIGVAKRPRANELEVAKIVDYLEKQIRSSVSVALDAATESVFDEPDRDRIKQALAATIVTRWEPQPAGLFDVGWRLASRVSMGANPDGIDGVIWSGALGAGESSTAWLAIDPESSGTIAGQVQQQVKAFPGLSLAWVRGDEGIDYLRLARLDPNGKPANPLEFRLSFGSSSPRNVAEFVTRPSPQLRFPF